MLNGLLIQILTHRLSKGRSIEFHYPMIVLKLQSQEIVK